MDLVGFGIAVGCDALSLTIAGILVTKRVKNRRKWSRILEILAEFEEGCSTSTARLRQVVGAMTVEMHTGLASDGGSKLGMLCFTAYNVKLALFNDWLFFDEKVDNIMNIEPAMLLMVNSLPQYVDITHTLLEFLFLLVDNYDVHRKEMIVRGAATSFGILVRKGVIRSLEPLISCSLLSPLPRERLSTFVSTSNLGVVMKGSSDFCSRQLERIRVAECHVEVSK